MERKKTNILFIGMAVVAVVILVGTGAYAYYQTSINVTTNGTIARWDFKVNNQQETFPLDFGVLYPGKTATYNLELSAENSDLDVYYEFIFHSADADINTTPNSDWHFAINHYIFFDSNYTKGPSSNGNYYIGLYGIIPAGQKLNIPLYYNWKYNEDSWEQHADGTLDYNKISIKAKQYTAYNGQIPMNLFGLDLVSYNKISEKQIIPLAGEIWLDNFGYSGGSSYGFEAINATSGYIKAEQ